MFVLVSFVGGVLADRWDRVKIVYGTDFIKGSLILISLIFLRIFVGRGEVLPQLVILFAIGVVNNILAAVFDPASTALIPQVVSGDQLMQANSLFSIQSRWTVFVAGLLRSSILRQCLHKNIPPHTGFGVGRVFCVLRALICLFTDGRKPLR